MKAGYAIVNPKHVALGRDIAGMGTLTIDELKEDPGPIQCYEWEPNDHHAKRSTAFVRVDAVAPGTPANDDIPEDEMLLAEGLARCGGRIHVERTFDDVNKIDVLIYPPEDDPEARYAKARHNAWCGAYDAEANATGSASEAHEKGDAYTAGAALYQALCEDAS